MTDYELVQSYQTFQRQLNEEGYSISPVKSSFFIHNKKGTIVADCQSIDGLRGFLQGVQWAKEAENDKPSIT